MGRRGGSRLILLGILLLAVGVAGIVCTVQIAGSREEYIYYQLEKARGLPLEVSPDGSIKVARAAIVLDPGSPEQLQLEKFTYYDERGNLARDVIRTPTREVVYEGGHPPRTVRDERTLLGRWGVLPPHGLYQSLAAGVAVVGLGLIIVGFVRRWRAKRATVDGV